MRRLSEDDLIAALRLRLTPNARPPLDEATLREAEARLGFTLPTLLRRLYGEVANGDFGPCLLPLTLPNEGLSRHGVDTVIAWYRAFRDNPLTEEDLAYLYDPAVDEQLPPAEWPERLLQISDWGCNIYSLADCSQRELPVLRNDNNVSWTILAHEAASLHEWLERWLDGEKLFYLDWGTAPKTQLPPFQSRAKSSPPGMDTDA